MVNIIAAVKAMAVFSLTNGNLKKCGPLSKGCNHHVSLHVLFNAAIDTLIALDRLQANNVITVNTSTSKEFHDSINQLEISNSPPLCQEIKKR